MKRTILLLTFLYSLSFAEPGDRREYKVDRITGLNVVTDSINIPPEEALDLENFVLDKFGALHKRFGIKNWNDSLVSADSIKDIHYVEDKNGDKTLFIATNNYIYELPGWTDTITSSTWAGYEIDYEIGKVDASNGTKYIYGDTSAGDDMAWIPVVDIGDIIIVGTDTLTVDSILTDTSLHVSANSSAHADASYRLLKSVRGVPRMTSSDGNLFVADSHGEPWWYDGEKPQLLGIIDEGNVTLAPVVDTTLLSYETGTVRLEKRSDIVRITGADISDTAFTASNMFNARYKVQGVTHNFGATIARTAILGSDTVVYLNRAVKWLNKANHFERNVPDVVYLPDTTEERSDRRWWITHKNIRVSVQQYKYIEDSTQIWGIDDYQGFWLINGKNALNRGQITTNSDKTMSFNAPNTFLGAMKITPSSANDSYTYTDTLCIFGGAFCDPSPPAWTSPGAATDIAMVCDSMVKYINDDIHWADFTATDSTTFYYIEGSPGIPFTVAPDTAQDTTTISSASGLSFIANDKYYVAWQTPSMIDKVVNFDFYGYNLDSVFVNEIFFSQIYFHRNRLYAIGREISRYTVVYDRWNTYTAGDTSSTARVWFADLGRPGYIPVDYNFDVTGANLSGENLSIYSHDANQALFGLRDDLYVTTNSNIYRISGEPAPGPEDLYLSQIVRGVGTNQSNGIVTTKDNVAYIMNQQAIWHFDGNVINKISYKIDPLVERYRNSRMVAGKFKDNLFFSYPDSNITIVMHDPSKGFSNWAIGMLTINDQSVAIDSNYFLFSRVEDSAFVLQYPRDDSTFTDILRGVASANYSVSYRSGWQTMGPWDYARKLNWFYMPYNQLTGDTKVFFFADGDLTDTLQIDTVSATGMILHRSRLNDVRGNFHQIFIKSTSSGDITLSGYKIECQDTRKER